MTAEYNNIFVMVVLYVHLKSEHCRILLFNFVHTSNNLIMQIDIKILKFYVYTWGEYHISIVYGSILFVHL